MFPRDTSFQGRRLVTEVIEKSNFLSFSLVQLGHEILWVTEGQGSHILDFMNNNGYSP